MVDGMQSGSRWALAIAGLIAASCPTLSAQEPRVSVGAVTNVSAHGEIEQAKETQQLLSETEARVAAEFIKATDVGYLDRVSMDALLAELRLSSSSAFDTSTGPAPGLLGRLDFLVVIESALPTSVRLRTIDVETGAVKAVGVCEASAGWLWGSSVDYSACLPPFVDQSVAAARQRLATKKLEAEEEAAADRAREREMAEAERLRNEAAAEAERRRQEAEEQAERQRREEQGQRAERERETERIRPDYERAMKRLSKELMFWDEMDRMMAGEGRTFRPEIEVGRRAAESKGDECARYFENLQANKLRKCVAELNQEVDALETFH